MAGLRKSQHLKLELKEIETATQNFKTCIGQGGFGKVYKGVLEMNGKHTTVAVKKLDEKYGQGLREFLTEIQLLTGQDHPNLISLLGYCDEGHEKLIVYEYAARGSLDQYITCHESSTYPTLSWEKRLKICADAARGLDHLHRHAGKHQAIIHRDIKGANILLDENWVAKISDLGLSKLSFAGLDRSSVISRVCGTAGYCEPEYYQTGVIKKESDVYSFGMVLFEVMCGRLCRSIDNDGFSLHAYSAKKYYENKKLDEIIEPRLRVQMSPSSLDKFSAIAYECLQNDRKERPAMDVVTNVLEETLQIQVDYELWKKEEKYWMINLPDDSEEIIEKYTPLSQYSTRKELFMLLHKGFFFDNDERFFQVDDDGKKCEIISAKGSIKQKLETLETHLSLKHLSRDESIRSSMMRWYPHTAELKMYFQISTSMLSMYTMYAVSLVFSFKEMSGHSSLYLLDSSRWVWIKWTCEELHVSSAHFARLRDDGNFTTTLWHFVNIDKNAYFDIILSRLLGGDQDMLPYIVIHGIEFQPVKKIRSHTGIKEIKNGGVFDQDLDWENKLPSDYRSIMYRSDTHLEYTAEKELYFLLCGGILIDNGRKWFSLCNYTGEKRHMLSAIDIFCNDSNYEVMDRHLLSESRFKEGIQLQNAPQYYFECKLEANMFSFGKLYASYLVFKLVDGEAKPDNECLIEAYCELDDKMTSTIYAHLNSREPLPIIHPKKKNTKLRNSRNMPKAKDSGVPKWCFTGTHNWMIQRPDGWMEVLLCKPFDELEKCNSMKIKIRSLIGSFNGIEVQGVEFRPTERDI